MPQDTLHPDYQKHVKIWRKCQDFIDGEEAVKAKGDAYLPRLTDQDDIEYGAYLNRAMLYEATARTVEGLTGAVMRKDPEVNVPKRFLPFFDDVGVCNESIQLIAKQLLDQVEAKGRVLVLVDAPTVISDDAPPYFAVYNAECVINWREETMNGKRVPVMIMLHEPVDAPDPDDAYATKPRQYFRELLLDETMPNNGERMFVYKQKLWEKREDKEAKTGKVITTWELSEEVTPTRKGGKTFDRIPAVVVGPAAISLDVQKSPILGLVNVNLSHYRNSADLEHGRHFTALPQAWVTGVADASLKLKIGSSVAWMLENERSQVGYLEFAGSGLGHLQQGMESKEKLMAVLGAKLLEQQQRDAEATETVMLRHAGQSASLSSIADLVSEALTKCVEYFMLFMGADPTDVLVKLNKDFDSLGIKPEMLVALMQLLQGGSISWDTFFYNAQRGELYPDGRTKDEELEFIEMDGDRSNNAGSLTNDKNSDVELEDNKSEEDAVDAGEVGDNA